MKKFLITLLALLTVGGAMNVLAQEAEELAVEEIVVEEAVIAEETEEVSEEDAVAKVGNTYFATIDDAVAAWVAANNSTLTLMENVTLSDVIILKSTEHHILNLGTYTMTAASGKNAIEILPEGVGTAVKPCLTIDADDANPGKLVATGKSCIYYTNTNKIADRLTITIKGGIFEGSYAMNLASGPRTALGITNSPIRGQSAPYVVIEGGVFNSTVLINAGMLKMTGGVCNSSFTCNGDSTAYRLIAGGKFKSVPTLTHDAEGKLTIGTSKGVYNGDVYIDEDGYYVIDSTAVSEKPGDYEASSSNAYKSQFNFSAIKDDKVVYFKDVEVAMNNFSDVKLYVDYAGNKKVNSGSTFTLDATENAYTGDVTLSKTGKFVIKYSEAEPYTGTVVNDTDHYGITITEVASEGIVTKTYAGYEIVDETNGVLMIVDGDNVEYFKTFDVAAESLYGTTGKTLTLIKNLSTVFINYNLYKTVPTEIIFDLNGNSITATNINGNKFSGDASIIFTDSSVEKTGTVTKDILAKIDNYGYTPVVKGGTWYADPATYLAYGYEAVVTEDGKYFVQIKDESVVEVVPDGDVESIDVETNVYYEDEDGNIIGGQVTVSLPSDAFSESDSSEIYLNVIATSPNEASVEFVGKNATVYEIEFVDENNEEVEFKGTATVTIPYSGDDYASHRIYFIKDDGTFENMNAVYDTDKKAFVFETTHFSQYALVNTSLLASGITENLSIMFKATQNPNVYEIYAVADEGKQINRLSSAQLMFNIENADTNRTDVAYTIAPYENIKMSEPDNDGYVLFNFDGVNAEDGNVADKVLLATVTFEGYGKFTFTTVDTASKAMVHTAEIVDNIVDDYTCAGNDEGKFVLILSGANVKAEEDVFGDIISTELFVPTKNLTVKIEFPNEVKNKAVAYQQMKLTVSGGDLEQPLTVELGETSTISDLDVYNGRNGKEVTAVFADSMYTVNINNLLTQNTAYVVTVEGVGYRTARYTVNTQEFDKTLRFWNNVKDTAVNVEEGKDSSAKNITFLAGDIVRDSIINIYDLSAVVSYFGEINLDVNNNSEYAKYDLNRDGKIDSKDVAYVLVSWGK